ncbi:MAG: C4-type zinc ribbon domain-containing protein [Ignavibacteria bacterium]|nr:C4-type zinc ribbon domain-containing protein [Ignavibacteria bacterium]
METKLRYLYALQQIDNNLDELEELKGDLPAETKALEATINELKVQVATLDQTMKSAFSSRDNADSEIISLKEKMEKYKAQQFEVRNNREYDALTREMDHTTQTIAKLEKEMEESETKAVAARTDIETTKSEIKEKTKLLEEKRATLAEVAKKTEAEELKYKHGREKLLTRIKKADLNAYERIRKAKRGKAIVPVKRGACGGCFNKVPPQKLLELRQNKKIYQCEHCGRIIVSDEIAETSSTVV